MKTKKRKKSSRMHGRKMGTHGGGARKKRKGSGHRGGIGLSGTGKRSDHKKTLITKLYGHGYFGKKGVTSHSSKKDKRKRINVGEIKATGKEIDLKNYKILGKGEVSGKLIIKAREASKSAIEKVEAKGGEIKLPKRKEVTQKQVSADKGKIDNKGKAQVEQTPQKKDESLSDKKITEP